MTKDPWTDPDPQPGDLDAELALLDPSAFEYHDGGSPATLRILVSVWGEDALLLQRIADARGKNPGDAWPSCCGTRIARPRKRPAPRPVGSILGDASRAVGDPQSHAHE